MSRERASLIRPLLSRFGLLSSRSAQEFTDLLRAHDCDLVPQLSCSHTNSTSPMNAASSAKTLLAHKLNWNCPPYCTISQLGRRQPPHLLSSLLGTSTHDYGVYFTEQRGYSRLKHQLGYIQMWHNNHLRYTWWLIRLQGMSYNQHDKKKGRQEKRGGAGLTLQYCSFD